MCECGTQGYSLLICCLTRLRINKRLSASFESTRRLRFGGGALLQIPPDNLRGMGAGRLVQSRAKSHRGSMGARGVMLAFRGHKEVIQTDPHFALGRLCPTVAAAANGVLGPILDGFFAIKGPERRIQSCNPCLCDDVL
jgi:hypothetical protein